VRRGREEGVRVERRLGEVRRLVGVGKRIREGGRHIFSDIKKDN